MYAARSRTVNSGGRGVDEAPVGPLDDEAGQQVGEEGPGIDADAMGEDLRPAGGRVAMHDQPPSAIAAVEEGIADPHQVLRILLLQRDTGAQAGMDENIVA